MAPTENPGSQDAPMEDLEVSPGQVQVTICVSERKKESAGQ